MTSLGWWAGTFLVMVILADRAAATNLTSHDVDLVKFWEPGPCGTSSWRTTLTLPPDLHATLTNRCVSASPRFRFRPQPVYGAG